MPTVAEQLRAAREAKHLSVNEVAEITKIRGDHIRALEEGNFDVFVAPVYIRGFARTYATLLKLDVPRVIQSLEAELGQTEKFAEPPPLTDAHKGALDFLMLQLSKVNLRQGAILLGLLLAVAAVLFAVWSWRPAACGRSVEKSAARPVLRPPGIPGRNCRCPRPLPSRANRSSPRAGATSHSNTMRGCARGKSGPRRPSAPR